MTVLPFVVWPQCPIKSSLKEHLLDPDATHECQLNESRCQLKQTEKKQSFSKCLWNVQLVTVFLGLVLMSRRQSSPQTRVFTPANSLQNIVLSPAVLRASNPDSPASAI